MDINPVDQIGARVDLLKSVLKLKNTDLARASGITSQSVADVIEGKVPYPKVNVIVAWVRQYNLRYEWLCEGQGSMFIETSEKSERAHIMSMLTSEMRHKDDFIALLLTEVGKGEGVLEEAALHRIEWGTNFFDLPGAKVGTPNSR